VKLLGLLQHERFIDERIHDLLLEAHGVHHRLGDVLASHLLVVFLRVVERALVLAEGDGLTIDPGRIRRRRGLRAVSAAASPLGKDEQDEDRHDHDQDPFEMFEAFAHHLEHEERPPSRHPAAFSNLRFRDCLARLDEVGPAQVSEKTRQFTESFPPLANCGARNRCRALN